MKRLLLSFPLSYFQGLFDMCSFTFVKNPGNQWSLCFYCDLKFLKMYPNQTYSHWSFGFLIILLWILQESASSCVLYSPWLHQLFGYSSIHSVVLSPLESRSVVLNYFSQICSKEYVLGSIFQLLKLQMYIQCSKKKTQE